MIETSTNAIWIMITLLKLPEWSGLHERLEEARNLRNTGLRSLMLNELAKQGDEEALRFMEAHRLARVKHRLLGHPL